MEIEEKLFQATLQQSKNVTGLLTDEYGNPIIGATILVDVYKRQPYAYALKKASITGTRLKACVNMCAGGRTMERKHTDWRIACPDKAA